MKVAASRRQGESPRTSIGLTGAAEGDLRALGRFLSFFENEINSLGLTPAIPGAIKLRLTMLAREVERTKIFIDGFETAKSHRRR